MSSFLALFFNPNYETRCKGEAVADNKDQWDGLSGEPGKPHMPIPQWTLIRCVASCPGFLYVKWG